MLIQARACTRNVCVHVCICIVWHELGILCVLVHLHTYTHAHLSVCMQIWYAVYKSREGFYYGYFRANFLILPLH